MKSYPEMRIINKCADIHRYAARRKISLSQLIEGYLKNLTEKISGKKNILDLVNELPKSKETFENGGRDEYYEVRKGKYGNRQN